MAGLGLRTLGDLQIITDITNLLVSDTTELVLITSLPLCPSLLASPALARCHPPYIQKVGQAQQTGHAAAQYVAWIGANQLDHLPHLRRTTSAPGTRCQLASLPV
jgi:hypothetical protein